MRAYAELAVTTNFSFLRGASHPEEIVAQAAALGLSGIGIADHNSFAGVVRAHVALREWRADQGRDGFADLQLAIGVRLVFADDTPDLLAYPRDRAAYGRLCRLLTLGKRRAPKGACHITRTDLAAHAQDVQFIVMAGGASMKDAPELPSPWWRGVGGEGVSESDSPVMTGADAINGRDPSSKPLTPDPSPRRERGESAVIAALIAIAPDRLWIGVSASYGRAPRHTMAARRELAQAHGLPLIAVGDVLYHEPERRALQDVVSCIRLGLTLDAAGQRLEANAERHLKPSAEMARLFHTMPEAIAETGRFMDGLGFSLDELRYEYPEEARAGFDTAQEALEHYTRQGARERFGETIPEKVETALEHELSLIGQLGYAPYFLTVHDIVRFARSRGILAQGRGSAANSSVCFCLGVTEVDPTKHDLLFERFVSAERKEPPDIDIDFEHERREEVMQYVYARYGRERAGLAASLITYRARSAIREVGKVFGLSQDTLDALSGSIWGWSSARVEENEVTRLGLDPQEERLAMALRLADELTGFPRHLSQHTGGFVITRTRLDEVTPVANAAMEGRTTVEWDKDDLDALGILKIDLLALGMLSCLRGAFDLLETHYDKRLQLSTIPAEDPRVYAMIGRADTLGVFQIESRAQMSMLPRLKPACFYDLVIEVAIVRPGPIQGDMVHPYLRRREGSEPVAFPAPAPEHGPPDELERVLGKTLGVPLFQEQAMRIAIVAAGFSPGEADRLRRAMATFRRVGTISTFARKMVDGMEARGYDRVFAERCFKQIEGFGEYGFPESHAASFALLVYASCWFKTRYPDVFACALLNAQPMGFYAPAQIVRDAREHGVRVEHPDINASDWDCTLEADEPAHPRLHRRHADMREDILSDHAIRLGFRMIKGLREADMRMIVERRGGGYDSVRDLWLRTGLSPAVLERLAEADAFQLLGLERRDALWAVKALRRTGDKDDLPLFAAARMAEREPDAELPAMPPGEKVVADYRALTLSLKAHPVSFLRRELAGRNLRACADLDGARHGVRIGCAGLVLIRQRPGSAKGVVFMTVEDESGIANLIVWPKVFERFRPVVLGARLVGARGRLQQANGVTHLVVEALEDLTGLMQKVARLPAPEALARGDEVKRPGIDQRGAPPRRPGKAAKIEALVREEPGLPEDIAARESERDFIPKRAVAAAMPRGRNFR
ncbi:error-prone DNA polymerase [Saliniramus sp.]|uniref:error-prone DNA polymerase n=1 Tax=Saliniramus sp. TaxID=2986772 RepID=UPI002CB0BDA9|nr:error-prone DNA polymerase [Saliniramus sp.]HMB10029.1 error-prone DNA polymerase [Saliniramus sp.]